MPYKKNRKYKKKKPYTSHKRRFKKYKKLYKKTGAFFTSKNIVPKTLMTKLVYPSRSTL